jgi:protein-tyrosine phosphatase
MKDIYWIRGNPPVPLAIVHCPSGGRGLHDELLLMRNKGIDTLISLLEADEATSMGLSLEGRLAEQVGLLFLSYPMPDACTPPSTTFFRIFIAGLADRLSDGEVVGVHCRGSIGRSTMVAACALIHMGWQARAALTAIAIARGCPVPDTRAQEEWILHYRPLP